MMEMELHSPVDSRKHRLLTHAEETALFQRLEAGDLTARDTLVELNQRLVHKLARQTWSRDAMTGVDDLVQAGNLGMLHAIDKFDWREGVRFSTYAVWWIRQSISRLALTAGAVPQDANRYQERKTESGRRIAAQRRRMATMLELDAPMTGRKGDEGSTLSELVAADGMSVEDEVFDKLMTEDLFALIRTDRQRNVIRAFMNGAGMVEAGRMHGNSHSLTYTILKTMRERARAKGYIMPEAKTCLIEGCSEPRMVSKRGATMSYCEQHQREKWREAAANRRNGVPPVPVLATGAAVHETYDTAISDSLPEPAPVNDATCVCDDTCVNKRVLDLLLESFPEAREMRDLLIRQEEVLAKIRQLRGG